MKFRAVIVDDEAIARSRLRKLLAPHDELVQIVGEAASGPAALEQITALRPDLVFLDIQMPGLDGFEVLRALSEPPLVIFITAYDEYALRAFEENSVDYLLKPVEAKRLAAALDKLTKITAKAHDDLQASLQSLLAAIKPGEFLRRLKVRVGERVLIIDVDAVACFRAENKYTTLYTRDKAYVIEESLSSLESRLDPQQFIRIHRSSIVNVACIQEIVKPPGENPRVRLRCARLPELPVSRGYAENLERI